MNRRQRANGANIWITIVKIIEGQMIKEGNKRSVTHSGLEMLCSNPLYQHEVTEPTLDGTAAECCCV